MKKIKLSQLNDDIEVSSEESSSVYTVAELKKEIADFGEPHHEKNNWYVVSREKWRPDARHMLENYVESEADEMYEDWDERAWNCLDDKTVESIQKILDEVFSGDSVSAYWNYRFSKPVEIDIKPNK